MRRKPIERLQLAAGRTLVAEHIPRWLQRIEPLGVGDSTPIRTGWVSPALSPMATWSRCSANTGT